MRKDEEVSNPESCLNRARPDELVFVLLGRDESAPQTIRKWAEYRISIGKNVGSDSQIREALRLADQMDYALYGLHIADYCDADGYVIGDPSSRRIYELIRDRHQLRQLLSGKDRTSRFLLAYERLIEIETAERRERNTPVSTLLCAERDRVLRRFFEEPDLAERVRTAYDKMIAAELLREAREGTGPPAYDASQFEPIARQASAEEFRERK